MALGDASEDGFVERENGSEREPYTDETDILYEQFDVWTRDNQGHREWARGAKEEQDFIDGKQWTEQDKAALEAQGRPALKWNRIAPLYNLLTGFYRQTRSEVRYLPGHDGAATQEIADTLTHTGKQIQEVEQYQWKEAEVFQDGIAAGRGFLRVMMDWETNILGNMTISVLDPFATYLDCDADSYDIADHQRVTYNGWGSLEEIALRYGGKPAMELAATGARAPLEIHSSIIDAVTESEITPDRFFGIKDYLRDETIDFRTLGSLAGTGPWDHVDRQRRLIRILDREHKKLRKCRFFVDPMTGDKAQIPDTWGRDKIVDVLQTVAQRGGMLTITENYRHAWRWTVTAADVVLFDDWSPYQTPSIIGFLPYFRRGITPGFARDLIDPQKEINKRRSVGIHLTMTTANSGWMVEQGAVEPEMMDGLRDEGSRPGIVVEWRKGSTPPARIQPAAPPTALKLLEESAARDLKEIAGINDSALGNVDRVQSGRAIEARQRQAIVSHERAFDNMRRTRELFGRKMMQLIQQFYTTERLIRVRGEGSGQDLVRRINERDATGRILNDVVIGTYSVVIDEAPATATFQQTQFEEMTEFAKLLGPEFVAQMADIFVEASSMPRKEEIKQRLLMMNQMASMQAQLRAAGMGGVPMPGMGAPGQPGGGGMPGGPPTAGGGGQLPPPMPPGTGGLPQMMGGGMPRPNMPMPGPRPAGSPIPPPMVGPMGAPMRPPPR
ncbi:MAG: hypothetical protein AB7O45_02740 [Alphaproteobacteria bacterium]